MQYKDCTCIGIVTDTPKRVRMEKSKYLIALKQLLWNSSRIDDKSNLYKQNSTLLNYISPKTHVSDLIPAPNFAEGTCGAPELPKVASGQKEVLIPAPNFGSNEMRSRNEVLHHTCPLLLNCAMYEVANVNGMAYDSAFTRTVVAKYEIRDYVVTYKSNEFYIEIDCQIWSQIERRIIPECIKHLLAARNVSGESHLVLIQNIDCLSESSLVILKTVIVDNLHHARFICTLRTHRYARRIFGTCATIIHCDYNIEAIVRTLLSSTRPDLVPVARSLAKRFNKDLSLLVATLHAPRPMLYIPHIESFVHEQLKILCECSQGNAYKHITKFVCDLMSCFIGIEQIWPYMVDFVSKHRPDRLYDVLQLLADTQVDLVRSNKIVFPYEALFVQFWFSLRSN